MTPTEIEQLQVIIIDDEMGGISQKMLLRSLQVNGILAENTQVYPSGAAYETAVKQNALSLLRTTLYFVDYHLKNDEIGPSIIEAIRKREIEQNRDRSYICGWSSDENEKVHADFMKAGADQTTGKRTNKESIEAVLDNIPRRRRSTLTTSDSSTASPPMPPRLNTTEAPEAHLVEQASNPPSQRNHAKPSLFRAMRQCISPVNDIELRAKP